MTTKQQYKEAYRMCRKGYPADSTKSLYRVLVSQFGVAITEAAYRSWQNADEEFLGGASAFYSRYLGRHRHLAFAGLCRAFYQRCA